MYNEVCYDKSFLKQVIIRLDFASPIEALEKAVPAKLVKKIIEKFPIVEPSELTGHEFSIDADGFKSKVVASKQWNYFGKDRLRKLTIAPLYIIGQYDSYTSYDEVKEQLIGILDAFAKYYPDTQISRFGLRYINQIDIDLEDPTKWDAYIASSLVETRNFFAPDAITRLISVAELKYDDVDVRFQYGIPNPDYPAEIKRSLYVLDIDASISQAFDISEINGNMDKSHVHIQELYERSITDALREKMNGRPIQE